MATKALKSDSVSWNTAIPETFQFVRSTWDVGSAKKMIQNKPRKIGNMNIAGVKDLVGSPPVEGQNFRVVGVTVDWSKAASDDVDLNVPVILCPHRDSYMPIDGWHRIAKAVLKGITELPCVVLTKAEAKRIYVKF
jgi:hypothetical protein